MTPFELIRNALFAGIGVQERVKEFLDELVKKGQLSESQGAKLLKEWSEKAEKTSEEITNTISDIVTKTLEKMNLPTREDVEELNKKIKTLSARIKKLEEALQKTEVEKE
jgi:polyhydroxyalkanoate synthesis regulator phasin